MRVLASVGQHLFPERIDNAFRGRRAALWLFGLFVALKLVMSVNSILNTASVAAGADGIPLESFGPAAAREVLLLFALVALGQLALALVALAALIRWRALVPFVYLVLLGEQLARRLIVEAHALERNAAAGGFVTLAITALLALGLLLSLVPAKRRAGPARG